MARMASDDGIVTVVCTPHFMPGVYPNEGFAVEAMVVDFSKALEDAGIPLQVVAGADAHATPGLISGLNSGRILTINASRYFLLEPPHDILPPRFEEFVFSLIAGGYHPVLTHPERLKWIDNHFDLILRLARSGVLMQLTAGSLAGRFGRRPRYWSERMLDEGLVHFVASDAHNLESRPPRLSEARDWLTRRIGAEGAYRLVATNPQRVLEDVPLSDFRLPDS